MRKLKIVIVDDDRQDQTGIAECVEKIFGKKRDGTAIWNGKIDNKFPDRLFEQSLEAKSHCDILVADQKLGDPSDLLAFSLGDVKRFAAISGSRMVVVKSNGAFEDHESTRSLKHQANVRICTIDEGRWVDKIPEVFREWCANGLGARRASELNRIRSIGGFLQQNNLLDSSIKAAQVIPWAWTKNPSEDNRAGLIELARCIGRNLLFVDGDGGSSLAPIGPDEEFEYLLVPQLTNKAAAPWECLLLVANPKNADHPYWRMETPIVRVLEDIPRFSPANEGFCNPLKSVLFVHDTETNWKASSDAVRSCAETVGADFYSENLESFLYEHSAVSPDIVHFHMHDPSPRPSGVEELLIEAIVSCGARLVILNACDSAQLLLRPTGIYTESESPLQKLLRKQVECCVSSQFLLHEKAADVWTEWFYRSLWAHGDVGIAVGNARYQTAKHPKYGDRLFELASITFARKGTPLINGGELPDNLDEAVEVD